MLIDIFIQNYLRNKDVVFLENITMIYDRTLQLILHVYNPFPLKIYPLLRKDLIYVCWFSFTLVISGQLRSCPDSWKFSWKPKDCPRALGPLSLTTETLIETVGLAGFSPNTNWLLRECGGGVATTPRSLVITYTLLLTWNTCGWGRD